MPKTLQFRRGSTSELSTVTGAVGELFVDTTKDTVVVMDGTTAGGTPLATETALTTGLASKADSSALTTGLAGKQNSLVSGTSIKTINNQSLLGSGNINITGGGSVPTNVSAFTNDANYATLDQVNQGLASKADTSALTGKQDTLASGTNIKTINNQSILGSGNITITGGGGSADFSAVPEDILPEFSEVYDIGSENKRFFDGYFTNKVDISEATLVASTELVSAAIPAVPASTTTTPVTKTFSFVNGTSYVNGDQVTLYSATAGDEWNTWAAANWNPAKLQGATIVISSLTSNPITTTIIGFVGSGPYYGFSLNGNYQFDSHIVSVDITYNETVTVPGTPEVPAVYEHSLTSNADIVTPRVVSNEAYIGNILYENTTLTPDSTIGQYSDIKGTVTVDGSIVVNDNLEVRNKINVKQQVLSSGEVISLSSTPATPAPITIDQTYAAAHLIQRIYFTTNGNWHTMYFTSVGEAAAFAEKVTSSTMTADFTFQHSTFGQFSCVLNITTWNYPAGGTSIEFIASLVSGTPPWNYNAWDNWVYPWYAVSTLSMVSATFNRILPATYTVEFAREVPVLSTTNIVYKNGQPSVSSLSTMPLENYITVLGGSGFYLNNLEFNSYSNINYIRLSYMGNTQSITAALGAAGTIVFKDLMSNDSWVLQMTGSEYSMPAGGSWIATFNILSASNPSYPTPYSRNQYWTGSSASVTTTVTTSVKDLLSNANVTIPQINKYTSSTTDIRSYFSVGDELSYKPTTTKIVFGDETSILSKAITYNESTGAITYDGLVQAVIINTATNGIYSSNIQGGANASAQAVLLGYNASGAGNSAITIGAGAVGNSNSGVAIGPGASIGGERSIAIGSSVSAGGSNCTYIQGGDNIGGMYHSTVIGMQGTGSSGWMWSNARHVTVLGTQFTYLNSAGDYATIINGGNDTSHMSVGNLIGGSTSFAPMNSHATLKLSCYQYAYVTSTNPLYPQFGYSSQTSVPQQFTTSASTSNSSTLRVDQANNQLVQGKVTLTLQVRNSDAWGIYEISFIARKDMAGSMSIVSQSTTALGNNNAATYWNTPVLHNNSGKLQFQITPTSSLNNQYLTVHVGGDVNVGQAY